MKFRRQLRTTFLIFLIVNASDILAADPNAVKLTKGDIAPFDGVELSDSYSKEVYNEMNNANKYKLLNDSLNKSISLYQANEVLYKQEISALQNENVALTSAVVKAKDNGFWKNALWFALGAVVSGFTVYASRK